MQIACERCGTTYVLDERVLPPGGAPVQCTKCSHVFTAKPPAPVTTPPSIPRVPVGSGTVIFGTPTPPSVPRVPVGTGTVVFGAAQPPEQQPARSSTQMFGAPALPRQPEPPAPARSSTQMFGAAGTPPQPEQQRSSTQMFGAVKPAEQKPPEQRSSTQMFGAVGAEPPKPAEQQRSSTQMFGAVKPAEQQRSSTQMFGAVKPAEQKPPEQRSSTQMFGAVGTEAPKPPEQQRSSTQMFGAVKPAEQKAPEQRSSTQMFGAVGAEPPKTPEQQRSSTQMFGAVKPAEQQRSSTQMFGAVGTEAPKPPEPRSSTQMFGVVGTEAPKPPEQRSSTQMFGAVTDDGASSGESEEPPRSRTVIFGNNPFDERVNPPQPEQPRSSTQMFGAATGETSEEPAAPERQSKTQIFGNNPFDERLKPPAAAPSSEFSDEPQEPPRSERTMKFGLAEIEAEHKRRNAPTAEPTADRPPTVEVSIDYDSPPASAPTPPPAAEAKPLPATRIARPIAPVELPPERAEPPPPMPFAQEAKAESEAPTAGNIKFYSDKPAKSRAGLVVTLFALGVLAVAGYFAARLWLQKQKQIPGDMQARLLSAQTLLRADDRDSLSRASAEFSALSTALPRWQEPRTWNAVSLALQLDDVNAELARLADDRVVLKRKIAKLEEDKDPADWETRVNVLNESIAALDKRSAPALETAKSLESQIDEWLNASEPSSSLTVTEPSSFARAKMMASAVRGIDPAQFVSAYQTLPNSPGGGWDVVAQGIYATRIKAAPDWMVEVTKNVEALRQSDTGFIRAHLVAARLQLMQGNPDAATSALDTAIALNPAHSSAKAMLESLQRPQ